MKYLFLLALLTGGFLGRAHAQAGSLTVNVTNFQNAKGTCRFWLFNSADGFPSEDKKAVKCVEVPITGTTSRYVFQNVPAGTYAVGVIHDQNGNHQMDTNFMGIPKEPYGTSNNVRGGVGGAPKFDVCSFKHGAAASTVAIVIK